MARTLASPHRIRCLSRQSHRHSRAHSAPDTRCLRAGDVNRGSRTAGTTGDFPAHGSDRAYPAKGVVWIWEPNRAPAAGSGGHVIRGPPTVVTSGMPQQLFHLAYEGCGIATTIIGLQGRNPALLMRKMESTSDIPGGPDLMCCCDHLPNSRWRPGFN